MKVSRPVVLVDRIPLDMARRLYEQVQRSDHVSTEEGDSPESEIKGTHFDAYA